MPPKDSPPWSAAAEIAAGQWGNVTLPQLLRCGCSREMIRTAVRTGRLIRVHQGVYALGRPPQTPHEQAMAAVLAGGSGALLSHPWGLWLFGLGRLPPLPVDVSVPRSRVSRPGVTLHRRRRLLIPDTNFGIPVTTPAQTLADCAPLLTPKQFRRAVNQAQIAKLTQRERLMEQPRLRGLVSAHGATRSELEDLLSNLARHSGLLPFERNHEIHGVEVDFYFPAARLVLEADGYAFHFTKIAFEDDHERRLYLEAKGERVIAVTHPQVTRHRARTASRLLAILAQAEPMARP